MGQMKVLARAGLSLNSALEAAQHDQQIQGAQVPLKCYMYALALTPQAGSSEHLSPKHPVHPSFRPPWPMMALVSSGLNGHAPPNTLGNLTTSTYLGSTSSFVPPIESVIR